MITEGKTTNLFPLANAVLEKFDGTEKMGGLKFSGYLALGILATGADLILLLAKGGINLLKNKNTLSRSKPRT